MISKRLPYPKKDQWRRPAPERDRDRGYLDRMIKSLAFGLCGCLLIFLIPSIYFIEQNYSIFRSLAYDVRPDLVVHLEQEVIWLRLFFLLGMGATLIACVTFGRRLLNDFVKPFENVEDHLHALGTGDWSKPMPQPALNSPDHQFFLTYAQFLQSMRESAQIELQMLESLGLDSKNRIAFANWEKLMARHRTRLLQPTLKAIDSSAESSGVQPLRRVS